MFLQILIFVLIFWILGFLWKRGQNRPKGIPAGPWSLPLLGHLPLLGLHPHQKLLKWKKTYGPIYPIQFGSYPTIVLNDAELIRKAAGMAVLSGRPLLKYFERLSKNYSGFVLSHGPDVPEVRSFIQKNLKNLGYGSQSMENGIIDQIPGLLQPFEVHSRIKDAFDVKFAFSENIIAYLYGILLGEEEKIEGKKLQHFSRVISEVGTLPALMAIGIFVPIMEKFCPWIFGHDHLVKLSDVIHNFFLTVVNRQRETRIPKQPINLAQCLLDRQDGMESKNEWFVPTCIGELFGGGIETTSTTMHWIFYYYLKYPVIKKKLDQEISDVLGKDRIPAGKDRADLIYMEAFICEVLRKVTVLPFGIYHYALEDVEVGGYRIPKGWWVLLNLYGAHHDPEVWGDPEVFRPERFLDAEGRRILKLPDFMPFGTGKRMCVGENLARNQLFLFFVSLIQKYDVEAVGDLPDANGVFGISLACKPFKVRVFPRS